MSFHVQDVYRITGIGTVLVGHVNSRISVGEVADVRGKPMRIVSIEQDRKRVEHADSGQVGIQVRGVQHEAAETLRGTDVTFTKREAKGWFRRS